MQVMRSVIRSRTVTTKQAEALIPDHTSKTQPSPIHPPLFRPPPTPFTHFPPRFPADPAAVTMTTPAAVRHGRPGCPAPGPCLWNGGTPPRSPETPTPDNHSWERGLLDLLHHQPGSRRKLLIRPHLKIRIPPGDAGKPLSREEMELSENYTCVITHGPKQRTTHIFNDCVVEICSGVASMMKKSKKTEKTRKREKLPSLSSDHAQNPTPPRLGFLSFCDACNKKLGEETDIYIYRGEMAFCSEECRSQAMHFDEGEFYWP